MASTSLRDLVASLLEAHGYTCTPDAELEGRSGTIYTVGLLAESTDENLVFEVSLNDEPADEDTLADMNEIVTDIGADLSVLVHLGPAATHPPAFVRVWGRDELAALIGDAQLAAATDDAPRMELPFAPPEFVPVVNATLAEPEDSEFGEILEIDDGEEEHSTSAARAPALGTPPPATGHTIIIEDDDDVIEYQTKARPGGVYPPLSGSRNAAPPPAPLATPTPSPAANPSPVQVPATSGPRGPWSRTVASRTNPDAAKPASPPAQPKVEDGTIPILPIALPLERARTRYADRLYGDEGTLLRLQPVWLFDYTCELFAEGSLRSETVTGRVQINGSNRRVELVDVPGTTLRPGSALPNLDRDERTLRVSHERALEEARRFVLDAHSRLVDVTVEDPDAGYSFVEKRRVEPRPDHIQLTPLPLVHRPEWRLAGSNGFLVVDGVSGAVVESELRNQNPDSYVM